MQYGLFLICVKDTQKTTIYVHFLPFHKKRQKKKKNLIVLNIWSRKKAWKGRSQDLFACQKKSPRTVCVYQVDSHMSLSRLLCWICLMPLEDTKCCISANKKI